MKSKVASFFFIAITLFTSVGAFAQLDQSIMRQIEMKQYKKAKSLLIAGLKSGNSASNWFYLGKIYSIQNNVDSAKVCFGKVALIDPKSSLAPVGEAIISSMTGNKVQALATLDKIQKVAVSAKDMNSVLEIAEARFIAGDTLKWPELLNTAQGFDRKSPKPYVLAGKLYSKLGENYLQVSFNGLASGRFEQALYYDPSNSDALTSLADIYIRARNYGDAENLLNKVLAKDSLYLPALQALGELEYTLGKYDIASKAYGKYIELAEYNDKELVRYITILYFNKQYQIASKLISGVLVKDPENAVMLRLKGYTSYELLAYPEGLDAMNKFFTLRSTRDTSKITAMDYEYYGKLFIKTGSDSLGVINLKKALELDSTKTALYEEIAKSFEKQKKNLQAVEYFEKYIAARNGMVASSIYFNIGKDMLVLANEVVGQADSAMRPAYLIHADSAFSKVVSMSPNSHLGFLWRARVLAAMDPETSQGLAKDDYDKAIQILEGKNDPQKYKNDLMEGYRYMGYYFYLKFDAAKSAKDEAAKEQAKTDSLNWWNKVLVLDPENAIAKQAIPALK